MSLKQIALHAGAFSFSTQTIFKAIDLTLDIRKPLQIGLHGDNGAGKTTLIKLLTGQLTLQSGTIRWLDANNQTIERSRAMTHMGVGMADRFFMQHQSLYENLALYARLTRTPLDTADQWLDKMNLTRHQNTPFGQLSTGQRKKASLIRAVMHQPDILFLDEPFSGLDTQSQDVVAKCLTQYPGAWLVASHQHTWLEAHCTHQWQIAEGTVHDS